MISSLVGLLKFSLSAENPPLDLLWRYGGTLKELSTIANIDSCGGEKFPILRFAEENLSQGGM
ncbi:hypothetical protein [Spongorhabdus nitratireducens]